MGTPSLPAVQLRIFRCFNAVCCRSKKPARRNMFLVLGLVDADSSSTATAGHCKLISTALSVAPAKADNTATPVARLTHSTRLLSHR
jgi:hypothetical protein